MMASVVPGANGKRGSKRRLLVVRALFVLLLGLNLTLVCQGHLHDGHYTDAHITLLGEPADGSAARVVSTAEAPKGLTGIVPTSNSQEPPDLAGLSLVFLLFYVGTRLLQEVGRGWAARCKSQIVPQPQAPPPRREVAPISLLV